MNIAFESKDRRRIWSIVGKDGGHDVNGVRFDGAAWQVAGHNWFATQEAAEGFCRDICGEGARRLQEDGSIKVCRRPGSNAAG